jgi:charged multivesicular body protein 4
LDEELEELMQEQLDEKMMKTGNVPADKISALPSAPQGVKAGKAPIEEDDEEEELRKLQAEMAM